HRVVSLRHTLAGRLWLNGEPIDFSGGTGYLEGDRGTSFPRRYLWSQCNRFAREDCCVMLSVAEIPIAGTTFPGCICCVLWRGRELRLATYLGARPLWWDETGAAVAQGKLLLLAEPLRQAAQPLYAPSHGAMSRVIRESAAAAVRYRLYEGGRLVFDLTGETAGFEFSEEEKSRCNLV
ncbi:MAG: tocopherol cyclase family protein, partial [Oscillospiraceae bacterium]